MKVWYRAIMEDTRLKRLPVCIVRYEDLATEPEEGITNIMKIMVNLNDLSGTNAERRVNEVLAKGKDATLTYSLKDNKRNLNNNVHRYTQAQLEFIKTELKEMLHYFGYAKIKEDPDNETGYFEFDSDPEMLKLYKGYRQLSRHSIEWNAYMTDDERRSMQYMCSDRDKEVEVTDFSESGRNCECELHDAHQRMFGDPGYHVA